MCIFYFLIIGKCAKKSRTVACQLPDTADLAVQITRGFHSHGHKRWRMSDKIRAVTLFKKNADALVCLYGTHKTRFAQLFSERDQRTASSAFHFFRNLSFKIGGRCILSP